MATITQPTINPTNKLTAATLATASLSVVGLVLKNIAPEWYDAEVMLAIAPVWAFAVGWLFRDSPNIVVKVEGSDE